MSIPAEPAKSRFNGNHLIIIITIIAISAISIAAITSTSEPIAEPAKSEPIAEPAKSEPIAEPAKSEPIAEPAKSEPIAEPAKSEPEHTIEYIEYEKYYTAAIDNLKKFTDYCKNETYDYKPPRIEDLNEIQGVDEFQEEYDYNKMTTKEKSTIDQLITKQAELEKPFLDYTYTGCLIEYIKTESESNPKDDQEITKEDNLTYDPNLIKQFNEAYPTFYKMVNQHLTECKKINSYTDFLTYVLAAEQAGSIEAFESLSDALLSLYLTGYDDSSIGKKMKTIESKAGELSICYDNKFEKYGK